MKKLFVFGIVGLVIPFFNAESRYVLPVDMSEHRTLELYSYMKGYVLEQEAGNLFSQRDLAIKYGIKYTFIPRLETYIEPPLVRYHYGKKTHCWGLGDMDIGLKVLLVQGVCGYAFMRIPTGAGDKPSADDWVPKFSTPQKLGGGGKLIFGQELVPRIKAHLNIGVLTNIGTEDTVIPSTRVPLGLCVELPYGVFIETESDINRYREDMTIAQNPKRVVFGINYKLSPWVKILAAFEYGSWGTGDPPIHKWSYGWVEDVMQWNMTIGVSYSLAVKPKPKVEVVATSELEEREKEIAELKERLTQLEEEKEKLVKEISSLEEELNKLKAKPVYKFETHVVKRGDALWKVAREVYGKENAYLWHLIYHMNRKKIKNPNKIYPGQELKILKLPLEE